MKNFIHKFFLWIKDHFSILFVVLFRLHIGQKKKENPKQDDSGSNPEEDEVLKTEKGFHTLDD